MSGCGVGVGKYKPKLKMGKGHFSLLKAHICVIFFIKRQTNNITRLYFSCYVSQIMSFFTILSSFYEFLNLVYCQTW